MKTKYFLLNIFLLFIFGILMVSSTNFPSVDDMPVVGSDTGSWGNKLLRMHNKTVETIQVSLTENGTLKEGAVNDKALNLSNITLADFSNDRVDLFALLNFTNAFSNRLSELWNLGNFTRAYANEYSSSIKIPN